VIYALPSTPVEIFCDCLGKQVEIAQSGAKYFVHAGGLDILIVVDQPVSHARIGSSMAANSEHYSEVHDCVACR
jgi:hypothetical protein